MTAPTVRDWEIRFDEKFVRSDGLMNKYTWDEESDDFFMDSTANQVKKFIRALLKEKDDDIAAAKAEGYEKAIAYIEKAIDECPLEAQTLGLDATEDSYLYSVLEAARSLTDGV